MPTTLECVSIFILFIASVIGILAIMYKAETEQEPLRRECEWEERHGRW